MLIALPFILCPKVRRYIQQYCYIDQAITLTLCCILFYFFTKELYELKFNNFHTGCYNDNNEDFPGIPYLELLANNNEKMQKLLLKKPVHYAHSKARRCIHNCKDLLSPWGLLQVLCNLCHPDQVYIFCHLALQKLLQQFAKMSLPYKFDAGNWVGINTISKWAGRIAKKCDLDLPAKCGNYGWHSFAITRLTNMSGMAPQELLSHAHHTNQNSQLVYK